MVFAVQNQRVVQPHLPDTAQTTAIDLQPDKVIGICVLPQKYWVNAHEHFLFSNSLCKVMLNEPGDL